MLRRPALRWLEPEPELGLELELELELEPGLALFLSTLCLFLFATLTAGYFRWTYMSDSRSIRKLWTVPDEVWISVVAR